jgi:hypothetical protein
MRQLIIALSLLVATLTTTIAYADPDCAGNSGNHFDNGSGNGNAPHHDSPACK